MALDLIDSRLTAIKASPLVGSSTCSYMNECWEPAAILYELNTEHITSDAGAVEWAHGVELATLEQGTNCSSGEPDCSLIQEYRSFKDRLNEFNSNT